jgi:hypothetical protein
MIERRYSGDPAEQPVMTRRAFASLAVAGAAIFGAARTTFAQDDNDNKIQSTKLGEIPTGGGIRPGPIGFEPAVPTASGVIPVSIAIDAIQLNAQVETIEIVDGVMQDPTGPWVVSWYKETAKLGEIGNAVMAGHLDYWDVGPAVFKDIGSLKENDEINITGDDGADYVYAVEWVQNFDTANAPIQEIVGPTDDESLTLITCGGPFDYENGVYLQRTVVRSNRRKE